jgi:hypothetical protein
MASRVAALVRPIRNGPDNPQRRHAVPGPALRHGQIRCGSAVVHPQRAEPRRHWVSVKRCGVAAVAGPRTAIPDALFGAAGGGWGGRKAQSPKDPAISPT